MPHLMQIKATVLDPASMDIDLNSCQAVLFDMDGVITKTTKLHASAWKVTFDALLKELNGAGFTPFDLSSDYKHYVDGKPRYKGVISFLESRAIKLELGNHDDPSGFDTIWAVANLKNDEFHRQLENSTVEVYDSTVQLVKVLRANSVKIAVVTASENGHQILQNANILDLFDTRVDGVVAHQLNLAGKPDPGVFLEAAKRLQVKPEHAIVVEDAIAGVKAGRKGGFLLTIGVARDNNEELLLANGADYVVSDLSEVSVK